MEARDFLLRALYQPNAAAAPATFHQDAAYALNAAMQEIAASPLGNAWNRRVWTFATVPGVPDYTLSREIANVIGDVRCDGRQVSESRFEAEFAEIGKRYQVPDKGRPQYYLLNRLRSDLSQKDAITLQMKLWPVPRRPHTIDFDAALQATEVSACDLNNPATVLPVPNEQAQSILLPIAMHYLLLTALHVNEQVRRDTKEKVQEARAMLGYSEPSPGRRQPREVIAS
jgi:hypothetical protein